MSAPDVRPPSRGDFAIMSTGQKLPTKCIMYGVPGIGKTSIAAQAPCPIVCMTHGENGAQTLMDNGIIGPTDHFQEAKSWLKLLQQLDHLLVNNTGHKTLILDTLGGAEALCFEQVTAEKFGGDRSKFDAFAKGPQIAVPEFSKLVHLMHKLNSERRMAIIVLAHCKIKTFRSPDSDDWDRYSADINDKLWAVAEKWSDMTLFLNYETFAKKDRDQMKAKGKSTGARFFFTTRTAAWDAKSRLNLPTEISMGNSPQEAWTNLVTAIKAARRANQPAVNGTPTLTEDSRVLAQAVVDTLDPPVQETP